VVALLAWAAYHWWPNDQKAIRAAVTNMLQAASFESGESGFSRLAYADRVASFFTTNATLNLDGVAPDLPALHNRTDLVEAAMGARASLRRAEFRLADLTVTAAEKRAAKAYVVVTGQINSNTNAFGQAFRVTMAKVNGRWLVHELLAVERVQ
jgi:glutathione S-transferase